MKKTLNSAFSLVELSIVIIIIGLLFVGVSGGSKLIESAKISRLMSEIRSIDNAIVAFNQAYDALPGDFDSAQSLFGTSGVNNGDGDGIVAAVMTTAISDSQGDEVSNVFVHLQLGEFIDGTYNAQIDQLSFMKEMAFSAYALYTNTQSLISTGLTNSSFYPSHFSGKNLITIGGIKTLARNYQNSHVEGAFLTNGQALSIDKKYDDGLMDSGNISTKNISPKYYSSIGDGDRNDCTYDVTITGNKCNLIIKTTF